MLVAVLAVIAGLALLVWGADRFVVGAAATARNFGVSPVVIGLTIVAVGTSAPEILVAATSSLQGNSGIAVGNAIGSNIANIGLVLGATAIVVPLGVRSKTLKREYPLMFAITLLAGALMLDHRLDEFDGAVLLFAALGLIVMMAVIGLRARRSDPMVGEFAHEIPESMSTRAALAWFSLGLVVLLVGARIVVWGAVSIANALGVSDLIIGLTVVAVGTSLPELAASIMSGLKQEPDIAIGNVIGSNMFNLLPVLGIPGLLAPGALPPEVMNRDFPVMLGLSVILFLVAFGFRGPGRITRWEGVALVVAFCAYQYLLYVSVV